MPNPDNQTAIETDSIGPLDIALEKFCFIIVRVRAFDVKDVSTVSDPGSNASDDGMIGVLEARGDDPVEQELRSFIDALAEDEQIDLVALAWLGRDDNTIDDWLGLRDEAARVHGTRPTSGYLLGDPLISDYLEEGLSLFGASCLPIEADHL